MEQKKQIAAMLRTQCARYPLLRPQDLLKALHQSVCGCGHFVADDAARLDGLRREASAHQDPLGIELLNETYCRIHLGFLKESGLSEESLFRLFVMSAEDVPENGPALEEGLEILLSLAREGELSCSFEEMAAAAEMWRTAGFPVCRHSPEFREAYHPAYRVIRREFVRLLPLLAEIDRLQIERERIIVALEGGSAAGKTTLAQQLSRIYDCNVFHMDDYFLRPAQRTSERLAEAGGNVDRERFLEEVLLPLRQGACVRSSRYNCHTQMLEPAVEFVSKRLNFVEGAYSMHPLLAEHYDLGVFLCVSPELQRNRIRHRNDPETAERFFSVWIPMEQTYFETMKPEEACRIRLESDA